MNLASVLGYVLVLIINHKTLRYSEGGNLDGGGQLSSSIQLALGVNFEGQSKVRSQLQNTKSGQRDE